MRSTRKTSGVAEISPEQRRGEVIAILSAGLVRLIQGSPPNGEKLSDSSEKGLELPRKTRLSALAG